MATGSRATSPLASELRIVLGRMLRRLRLPDRALSPTQAGVLGRLEREGTQSIGALAAAERVRPQSMSQTVVELEAEGLVARSPDETDGRRTLIALTEAGLDVLHHDRAQRDDWLAGALDQLSAADQDLLARAVVLLERLSNE
jgi:DNA-binding MarR family transcriptional regulator